LTADLTVVPGYDHEAVPKPGTVYSVKGPNAGRPANLGMTGHFPVTAHCTTCEEIILRERYLRLSPGDPGDWLHTGRKPGEPGKP
jgi:hypothetical protein